MFPIHISIVIPVYNGGVSFQKCLASIHKSHRQPDEIIVVADGDSDGSWQVAESFGATVFRLPSSGGPARARNVGAKAAQGDVLFFVDADVTLHSDTLNLIEQRFAESPELTGLIGSYDDEPGASNFLSQYKNLFHHYNHQISDEVVSTFWGACGAVRKSAFEAVGGFDERYKKPCIEDIELGYRLTQAGYAIRLDKNIQIKHLKQWQPISLLRAEIFYRALPWTELILRQRETAAGGNKTVKKELNLSDKNRFSVVCIFCLLGCLALMPWVRGMGFRWLGWSAIALILGLLLINRDVYLFFYRKRGGLFTLGVIPWHWLYFFYSGAAFAYGIFSRLFTVH